MGAAAMAVRALPSAVLPRTALLVGIVLAISLIVADALPAQELDQVVEEHITDSAGLAGLVKEHVLPHVYQPKAAAPSHGTAAAATLDHLAEQALAKANLASKQKREKRREKDRAQAKIRQRILKKIKGEQASKPVPRPAAP